MIGQGIYIDFCKAAEAVRKTVPSRVGYLELIATFSMVDKYGKPSEDQVARCGFTRKTLFKLYFENLLHDQIINAADYGWIRPELKDG